MTISFRGQLLLSVLTIPSTSDMPFSTDRSFALLCASYCRDFYPLYNYKNSIAISQKSPYYCLIIKTINLKETILVETD